MQWCHSGQSTCAALIHARNVGTRHSDSRVFLTGRLQQWETTWTVEETKQLVSIKNVTEWLTCLWKNKKVPFFHCSKFALCTIDNFVLRFKFCDRRGKCSAQSAIILNINFCPNLFVKALIGSCSFSTWPLPLALNQWWYSQCWKCNCNSVSIFAHYTMSTDTNGPRTTGPLDHWPPGQQLFFKCNTTHPLCTST